MGTVHPERPDISGFRLAGPRWAAAASHWHPALSECAHGWAVSICPATIDHGYASGMGLIITLLIIWLVLSILGFVIEGLLWLALIGLVLFAATAVWGWLKRRTRV